MNFANETQLRRKVVSTILKNKGFAQPIESPTARGIADVFFVNRYNGECGYEYGLSGWIELKVVRPRDRHKVKVSAAQWLWAHKAVQVNAVVWIILWHQRNKCFGALKVHYSHTYEDLRCLGLYSQMVFSEKEFDKWLCSL